MQVDFSIAKTRNAQPERREPMVKHVSETDIAVRQFFRPYVLAFLGLAIVYAGFSYAYKLSQYLDHPELTRASLTRAWVDHRNESIATVSHEQVRPAKLIALVLVTTAAFRIVHRTPDFVLNEPAPVREAFLFSSLIPFRAPPSTTPSLA